MGIDTNMLSMVSIGVAVFACIAAVASSIVAVLTYRKSKAPEVIVYLEADRDKGVLLLVVKNIGDGVAYDLRLDVGDLPVKDDLKKSVGESFVRSGIPMLVLDAQRSAIIHANSDAEREFGDKTYWALLRYYRSRGGGRRPRLPISDKFVLEYYTFASALYTKSDQYLSRVALEKIAGGSASRRCLAIGASCARYSDTQPLVLLGLPSKPDGAVTPASGFSAEPLRGIRRTPSRAPT